MWKACGHALNDVKDVGMFPGLPIEGPCFVCRIGSEEEVYIRCNVVTKSDYLGMPWPQVECVRSNTVYQSPSDPHVRIADGIRIESENGELGEGRCALETLENV